MALSTPSAPPHQGGHLEVASISSSSHVTSSVYSEKPKGLGTSNPRISTKRGPVSIRTSTFLSLPSLPRPEVLGRPPFSDRSLSPKQTHPLPLVQNVGHPGTQDSAPPKLLAYVNRLVGRLLACPSQPPLSEVSLLHSRRETLPIPINSLRAKHQPASVHQSLTIPTYASTQPRNHHVSLSRRLDSLGTNSRTVPSLHQSNSSNTVEPGLSSEPQKVSPHSNPGTHVPRRQVAGQRLQPHTSRQKHHLSSREPRSSRQQIHHLRNVSKSHRPLELSAPPSPGPHLLVHSDVPPRSKLADTFTENQTENVTLVSSHPFKGSAPSLSADTGTAQTPQNLSSHLDRCFRDGVGSSGGTNHDCETLEILPEVPSHHSQGNSGSAVSTQDPQSFVTDLGARLHRLLVDGVVHSTAGLSPFPASNVPWNPAFCLAPQTQHSPHSVSCPGSPQHLGGQPLTDHSSRERVVHNQRNLPPDHQLSSSSGSGSVCSPGQQSPPDVRRSPQLSGAAATDALKTDWNRWIRIYLFPPPTLLPRVLFLLKGVSQPRSVHHSARPNRSLVVRTRRPSLPARHSSKPPPTHTKRRHTSIMRSLVTLSRVDFLTRILSHKLPKPLAEKVARPHRGSTLNQYQSAWVVFQLWVKKNNISWITSTTFLAFLDHLFSRLKLNPQTVMTYRNALDLPLSYAFNISTKDREFHLLARSQFLNRPPSKPVAPQWSLTKVLDLLVSQEYHSSPSQQLVFEKSLFLTALATANRASEIAALHCPSVTFSTRANKVTMPVKPGFLFKNQRPNRAPPNITMKILLDSDGTPHPLCPVTSLKAWLAVRPASDSDKVFIDPKSKKPLNAARVSLWLCRIIKKADPKAIPKGHDIRKVATSLAWARGLNIQDLLDAAFWSKSNVFIEHYLHPPAPDVVKRTTCVALNTTH